MGFEEVEELNRCRRRKGRCSGKKKCGAKI
jgi:hypothetical protein